MPRKFRKIILVLAAVLVLAYAVAAVLVSRIDLEPYTARLEKELSESLRVDVKVRGKAGLRLLPGVSARFADVVFQTGAGELLKVGEVAIGLKLFPLFRQEFQVNSLVLKKPVLTVRRAPDGEFNIKPTRKGKKSTGKPKGSYFIADRGVVEGGMVRYTDEGVGAVIELSNLNLTLADLHLDEKGRFGCAGNFSADRLAYKRTRIGKVWGSLDISHGQMRIDSLRADLYGAALKGRLLADLSGPSAEFGADLSGEKIPLGRVYREITGKPLIDGDIDLRAELSAHGPGRIVETLGGTVRVEGSDLTLYGIDLDTLIADFRKSQDVDLVDIGAFVFAGPIGSLFTQGYDMAVLYKDLNKTQKENIDQAVFDWKFENGKAYTKDVAFSTEKNRIAFQGAIDFNDGRYENFTLALLDRKGCAELTEEITGPVAKPSVRKTGLVETLAGPLVGILKKTAKILDPRKCKPFYQGSVAHPGASNPPPKPTGQEDNDTERKLTD